LNHGRDGLIRPLNNPEAQIRIAKVGVSLMMLSLTGNPRL
jgi:hypothetical protein